MSSNEYKTKVKFLVVFSRKIDISVIYAIPKNALSFYENVNSWNRDAFILSYNEKIHFFRSNL